MRFASTLAVAFTAALAIADAASAQRILFIGNSFTYGAGSAVRFYRSETVDDLKPGDPPKLIATSKKLADVLRASDTNVELYLMATWSHADQVYTADGAWAGRSIEAMAKDVRAAYDEAAAAAGAALPLVQVGPDKPLDLAIGINPAWEDKIERFRTAAVAPLLGERTEPTFEDWQAIEAKLAPFAAWSAAIAASPVAKLPRERLRAVLGGTALPRCAR